MQYRFKRPELFPTFVMILAVSLMFSLGIWQLKRLEWKNALLASIEAAQTQAPRNLLSFSPAELQVSEWRNVTAYGDFLYNHELYATPRYLNGQMGYAILTPLAVSTPEGKVVYVMVNRGWVSPERKDIKTRAQGNPDAPLHVTGVLRIPQARSAFRPDNRPDKNLWFWYDIPAMAKATGLPLLPVMIDATDTWTSRGTKLKDGPTPFPLEINIRNDHLGYAITWFLIGLSALVMYVIYYTEQKK